MYFYTTYDANDIPINNNIKLQKSLFYAVCNTSLF